MRAILPGKPQPQLQAATTCSWNGLRVIIYISGNALVILGGPNRVLQTIYTESEIGLEAVCLDEATGKIATCAGDHVYVYKPYGQDEDALKWSLQCQLKLHSPHHETSTLSWGADEELLMGDSYLTLFATHDTAEELWSKAVANPVKFAQFSPDAALIASTGIHDRFLKIWHRLGFGSAAQNFDYAYLPHPSTITGIHWRKPYHQEQLQMNVLYTTCLDNKMRIWVPGDPHGVQIMQLWGEIDLLESIQPRIVPTAPQKQKRYAFIIDSRDFMVATERAVQESARDTSDQHTLDHLIMIANRTPEVCVVLDDRGNMSAWGLENISNKPRNATDMFNIAHCEGLHLHLAKDPTGNYENVRFISFCNNNSERSFTILAHHFDGRMEWLDSRLDHLFDPTPRKERVERRAIWTGHSNPIKKVNRTETGRALVSRTSDDEIIVWTQRASQKGVTLHRHSTVSVSEHVHRTWLLHDGDFVVFLHHDSVSLWDARGATATKVQQLKYQVRGKPLCLLLLPEADPGSPTIHLATITSEMNGIVWELQLPHTWNQASSRRFSAGLSPMQRRPSRLSHDGTVIIHLKEFCMFNLGSGSDLAFVLPVDPAGSTPVISGFLDSFARDVAMSYTNTGKVTTWTARIDVKRSKVDWLRTSSFETAIMRPTLASGTSIRKAALVDESRTTLSIWNTKSAQLEYEEKFEHGGDIQDLDWSSTPDNQSILAVGFPHRVVVYGQLRYDYLDARPSWAAIREFRTQDVTPHPIGDSVWLSNGHLVIGAGNQLFIQDEHVEVSESFFPDIRLVSKEKAEVNLFTLVSRLNGPLPVYHPQFVAQCILSGKLALVQSILVNLHKNLKYFTDGDDLDWFLGLKTEDFSQNDDVPQTLARKEMHSSYTEFFDDDEPLTVTEEVATSLKESLTKWQLPLLSSCEQFHLADIVECIGTLEKHRRSVDINASRFLLFFRQHMLRSNHQSAERSQISWREITWAYHSESQDILVDLITRHFQGRMLWKNARDTGMFIWMTDLTALRTQFEVIARNEYTKTDEKNPVDCSLYYLALKKKPVLVGLWRMATWSREQGATQRLLANNFTEARWKTAALKNAYALMGRRRFEYAAAFFLLADHLSDAVQVLSNQMQDTQLAIAIARVYEGDDGPVLHQLLQNTILPKAVKDGNRWLATWAFWHLNKRDSAVRALVSPLSSLVSPPGTLKAQSMLFLADDPALVVLYKQLRAKSLQTLRGAIMVSQRVEWEFVIHTAQLYQRMGCDFLTPPPQMKKQMPTSPLASYDLDPRKLLRRRSSLVVADLPIRRTMTPSLRNGVKEGSQEDDDEETEDEDVDKYEGENEKESEKKKSQPPTQFNEPDANSLLDSFGF
ncbi:WD repeat protein-like protein [Pseudovirgaria hyperparasitica]|uniref:WD repeat protein-like protein n=1 Tax=Pseudovirgaria hyperparasitica TaxID=470096 RepID=A0A6A6W5B7_9PEZI|nr:WD repeat protein-like protein [Pseudovirgaria hyperparasitica]KAF2757793.1 WD repeat protein-like protein [Pseudovirgaria hyperparasitica]